ncbi:MAG: hypothetical protein ACYC8T_06765 [Myxococcaceae bacterium]
MNDPGSVAQFVAEFVRLNAKLKVEPLSAEELERWHTLKQELVDAQQVEPHPE